MRSEAQENTIVAVPLIMAAVFLVYLVIGLALPVLPLHVHLGLGLSAFVVGIVAGSQFAATMISRLWAGTYTDREGARRSVVISLLIAAASGLFYLISLAFMGEPATSVMILLVGRALLGGAESFVTIGALSWVIYLMGRENTGKVMSWVGVAVYAAYAVGAPAGTVLYAGHGFVAIALVTMLLPLGAVLLIVPLRPVAPSSQARPAFANILRAVWVPGFGLALSSIGFGAITVFITLFFAKESWNLAWLALTALSTTFIVGRLALGHLPDRIGGAKIAFVCVLIEAAGQALIWLAPAPSLALFGAGLTGLGYSLVYPGFGVEAVRRAPPESRALAVGVYTACLDLALGVTSPALGLIANGAGLRAVYLVSMLVVLCSAGVAVRLLYGPSLSPG